MRNLKYKKLSLIILIVVILLLSIAPLNYVFAGGSCSGSPVTCTLADAFSFIDNLSVQFGKVLHLSDSFNFVSQSPTIILGRLGIIPTDRFNFLDHTLQISISNNQPPINPFVSTTTTGINGIIVATDNVQDIILTELAIPIVFLIAVMFFAIRLGIKEFPIILGVAGFAFLGVIYIGILPTWIIVIPIIFASTILALMVSKWLGSRGTAET